jgi:glutamate-1-semialdehyde aminotransferase
VSATDLKNSSHGTLNDLAHLGMMIEGVEFFHSGGMTSTAHTPELIDETVASFGRVLDRMVDEGAWG